MELHHARQAWHDALYSASSGPMNRIVEQARLGTLVQQSKILNSSDNAIHQVQSGLVQAAVATLPKALQNLGHWLYAPDGFVKGGVEYSLWQMLAEQGGIKDSSSDEWFLVHCALHRYREIVWQRPEALSRCRTPRQIRQWIETLHDVEIASRRWARKYAATWERLLNQLDELDQELLAPVAEVVVIANMPVDRFEWNRRTVIMEG